MSLVVLYFDTVTSMERILYLLLFTFLQAAVVEITELLCFNIAGAACGVVLVTTN